MRILRTAILAVGLMGLAAACGGKDKGAEEPAAETTTPAEGETATDPAATDPATDPAMGEEGAGEEGGMGEEGGEGGER